MHGLFNVTLETILQGEQGFVSGLSSSSYVSE